MAVLAALREQMRQLEAQQQFLEAQTPMFDSNRSRLGGRACNVAAGGAATAAAASCFGKGSCNTPTTRECYRDHAAAQGQPRGHLHTVMRGILVVAAAIFARPVILSWRLVWSDRYDIFGATLGTYLAPIYIALCVTGLYTIIKINALTPEGADACVMIEWVLQKLGLNRWLP